MPISEVSELQIIQAKQYQLSLTFTVPGSGMPYTSIDVTIDTSSQEVAETPGAFDAWVQEFIDHAATLPTFVGGFARKNYAASQTITATPPE